jgi:enoyl-CoA hydratase/carnithine racemase
VTAITPTKFAKLRKMLMGEPSQLDPEKEAFEASMRTADFREAMAAFFGKRSPVFTGR